MRSVALAAALAAFLSSHQAMAADLVPAPTAAPSSGYAAPAALPAPSPIYYVGVSAGPVHHTGYVPGTASYVEDWVYGGKAFAGAKIVEWARIEVAYFYLGKSSFLEGTTASTERSHAAAASVVVCCVWLQRWVYSPWPIGVFGRAGGAYKFIDHRSAVGTFNEGGVSYLLGFGVEVDFTPAVFMRAEYEYISKVISGTNRAIDVQHTPITLGLGLRF
jgi:opacity protein-like surface antigen